MNPIDATEDVDAPCRRLQVLLIIDSISSLQPGHDSSVAIMEAAQRRGHDVSVTTIRELSVDGARPIAACSGVSIEPAILRGGRWTTVEEWYSLSPSVRRDLDEFDVVMMRADPPVDGAYLRATYILDFIDPETTILVNSPAGLRNANEKLFGMRVPEIGPTTLLTADKDVIIERVRAWGKAVLKPTDAMAGRGVLVLKSDDVNLHSILDGATERGLNQVVVQDWIEGASEGDRRIIVIGGEPVGVVRRVAQGDDFRCNMAAGAASIADEIGPADRELCTALAPHLEEHGLIFVGLDVIGGQVTEINVTSPTGIREIAALSGIDVAEHLLGWAELKCEYRMELTA